MLLFKCVNIDLDKERERIKAGKLNKRQRTALFKLVDLFEQGKFQECIDHIKSKENFPYHPTKEYYEREHINREMFDTLVDMTWSAYYTKEQIASLTKPAK